MGHHRSGIRAAHRCRASFDARPLDPARAWLFGIARNAALDELRRRSRLATLVADPEDPAAAGAFADDDTETAARRATVRAALKALDARDREVVALKFHARAVQRRDRARPEDERVQRGHATAPRPHPTPGGLPCGGATPKPSTPLIARELDELEAALAGDPNADPQLLALIEDVRAERPGMDAGFATRLDERVEQGFPRPDGGPAAWLRGLVEGHRARMLPALGVAATLLLGATATVLLVGGDDSHKPVAIFKENSPQPIVDNDSGGGAGAGELAPGPASC